jgi:hypothetical protein
MIPVHPDLIAALARERHDALRARYRESRDLFSAREMARLHFVRWLVRTGRLAP